MGGLASAGIRVGEELWEKLWSPSVEKGALQAGEAGLKRLGPMGETLAGMLRTSQEKYETRAGQLADFYIPKAHAIQKDATLVAEHVADLKRKAPATTSAVKDLNDFSRLANEGLYQEAQKVGIKVGSRVPDDWHYMYDPKIFDGIGEQAAIKHLVTSGQAADVSSARKILERVKSRAGGKVHTLESPRRVTMPGSREDTSVMFDHLNNSVKRIEQAKIFGPKDENLHTILSQIEQSHGAANAKYAKMVANAFLGRAAGQEPVNSLITHGAYQKIASIEAVAHLGLATLSHALQPLNTVVYASRTGMTPVIKALAHTILEHGNATDFALRTGALLQHTVHDFRRLAGVESENLGGKVLRYNLFSYVGKLRETFAANVGREMLEAETRRLLNDPSSDKVRASIRLLGLDPDELLSKGITDSDRLTAGNRVNRLTQFRTDALSVPPLWRTDPYMKLFTMYKQYFFNQARFVKDEVYKPAFEFMGSGGKKGSMAPLMYMSVLYPTFGEITADMKEMARKGSLEGRPQNIKDRLMDNYAQVGGFGIMHDLVHAFASPGDMAFRFSVGPFISDMVDIGKIPFAKHPIEETEKKIVRSVPVVGPITANKLWPPKKKGGN